MTTVRFDRDAEFGRAALTHAARRARLDADIDAALERVRRESRARREACASSRSRPACEACARGYDVPHWHTCGHRAGSRQHFDVAADKAPPIEHRAQPTTRSALRCGCCGGQPPDCCDLMRTVNGITDDAVPNYAATTTRRRQWWQR